MLTAAGVMLCQLALVRMSVRSSYIRHCCEKLLGVRVLRSLEAATRVCNKLASYPIDPVGSHMLVSKIKPCMSKYTSLYDETANGSLNQLWFIGSFLLLG